MSKIIALLLFMSSLGSCVADRRFVQLTLIEYQGCERKSRVDGDVWFLNWRDIQGKAHFYSRSDSIPSFVKGYKYRAFINF